MSISEELHAKMFISCDYSGDYGTANGFAASIEVERTSNGECSISLALTDRVLGTYAVTKQVACLDGGDSLGPLLWEAEEYLTNYHTSSPDEIWYYDAVLSLFDAMIRGDKKELEGISGSYVHPMRVQVEYAGTYNIQ